MEKIQDIINDQIHLPGKLLSHYTQLNLTETEVMLIIQIHYFIQIGDYFPTPNKLSSNLSIDERSCTKILRTLIQRKLLNIEQKENKEGRLTEVYSLTPLWQNLYSDKGLSEEDNKLEKNLEIVIFQQFEQEFGRPLSPFEIELISGWIDTDRFDIKLIEAALREAVLLGKLNLKYIDRILREWNKKGIRTVRQAKEASRSFHKNQAGFQVAQNHSKEKRDTSFYYNWLEGEE